MTSGSPSSSAATNAKTDNRLDFLDQAAFLRLRATDFETVGQSFWVYDRPVDMDAVRRFNRNLGYGLLGRRVERSPLPFGRHRWVACHDAPEIDVAPAPRPRAEIGAWLDERAQVPVDPEFGPCWHLGVLPLDDGGTAVTYVCSHTVVDGVAASVAIYEAVNGITRDFGYPPPGSRGRARGLMVDVLETLRGIPQVIAALFACIMILLRRGSGGAGPTNPAPRDVPGGGEGDEEVIVPSLTLWCDLASWDARALDLGGSSSSLLIAFATRLAQLIGRVSPVDGSVTITVPVSERTADDARGNALTAVTFRVDPDRATTDLQVIRNEMKQHMAALQHTPNELLKPLPLIPFTPKWLARQMEGLALGDADLPVCSSNLRDVPQDLSRMDGADCRHISARMFNRGATRRRLENERGQLYVFSGRINGEISISLCAYQPGAENSNEHLRALVEETLAGYQLTADIL